MYEKINDITKRFGAEVRNKVYEHYDVKRARNHEPYDPAHVFADIEDSKTFVGKIGMLWLKYKNRYIPEGIEDYDVDLTDEDMRTKDYEIIWLEDVVNKNAGTMCIAEILPPFIKKPIGGGK